MTEQLAEHLRTDVPPLLDLSSIEWTHRTRNGLKAAYVFYIDGSSKNCCHTWVVLRDDGSVDWRLTTRSGHFISVNNHNERDIVGLLNDDDTPQGFVKMTIRELLLKGRSDNLSLNLDAEIFIRKEDAQ